MKLGLRNYFLFFAFLGPLLDQLPTIYGAPPSRRGGIKNQFRRVELYRAHCNLFFSEFLGDPTLQANLPSVATPQEAEALFQQRLAKVNENVGKVLVNGELNPLVSLFQINAGLSQPLMTLIYSKQNFEDYRLLPKEMRLRIMLQTYYSLEAFINHFFSNKPKKSSDGKAKEQSRERARARVQAAIKEKRLFELSDEEQRAARYFGFLKERLRLPGEVIDALGERTTKGVFDIPVLRFAVLPSDNPLTSELNSGIKTWHLLEASRDKDLSQHIEDLPRYLETYPIPPFEAGYVDAVFNALGLHSFYASQVDEGVRSAVRDSLLKLISTLGEKDYVQEIILQAINGRRGIFLPFGIWLPLAADQRSWDQIRHLEILGLPQGSDEDKFPAQPPNIYLMGILAGIANRFYHPTEQRLDDYAFCVGVRQFAKPLAFWLRTWLRMLPLSQREAARGSIVEDVFKVLAREYSKETDPIIADIAELIGVSHLISDDIFLNRSKDILANQTQEFPDQHISELADRFLGAHDIEVAGVYFNHILDISLVMDLDILDSYEPFQRIFFSERGQDFILNGMSVFEDLRYAKVFDQLLRASSDQEDSLNELTSKVGPEFIHYLKTSYRKLPYFQNFVFYHLDFKSLSDANWWDVFNFASSREGLNVARLKNYFLGNPQKLYALLSGKNGAETKILAKIFTSDQDGFSEKRDPNTEFLKMFLRQSSEIENKSTYFPLICKIIEGQQSLNLDEIAEFKTTIYLAVEAQCSHLKSRALAGLFTVEAAADSTATVTVTTAQGSGREMASSDVATESPPTRLSTAAPSFNDKPVGTLIEEFLAGLKVNGPDIKERQLRKIAYFLQNNHRVEECFQSRSCRQSLVKLLSQSDIGRDFAKKHKRAIATIFPEFVNRVNFATTVNETEDLVSLSPFVYAWAREHLQDEDLTYLKQSLASVFSVTEASIKKNYIRVLLVLLLRKDAGIPRTEILSSLFSPLKVLVPAHQFVGLLGLINKIAAKDDIGFFTQAVLELFGLDSKFLSTDEKCMLYMSLMDEIKSYDAASQLSKEQELLLGHAYVIAGEIPGIYRYATPQRTQRMNGWKEQASFKASLRFWNKEASERLPRLFLESDFFFSQDLQHSRLKQIPILGPKEFSFIHRSWQAYNRKMTGLAEDDDDNVMSSQEFRDAKEKMSMRAVMLREWQLGRFPMDISQAGGEDLRIYDFVEGVVYITEVKSLQGDDVKLSKKQILLSAAKRDGYCYQVYVLLNNPNPIKFERFINPVLTRETENGWLDVNETVDFYFDGAVAWIPLGVLRDLSTEVVSESLHTD